MDAGNVIALVAAGVAAIVSVTVPLMTFRLALRQDQMRWLRERRADVYVDILTEARAEYEWFQHEILDDETRERMAAYYVDLRLPPLERTRLGARGTIFGSREINRLFNEMQGVGGRHTLVGMRHEGDRIVARVAIAGAFEALQTAIRRELGADEIPLTADRAGPTA